MGETLDGPQKRVRHHGPAPAAPRLPAAHLPSAAGAVCVSVEGRERRADEQERETPGHLTRGWWGLGRLRALCCTARKTGNGELLSSLI